MFNNHQAKKHLLKTKNYIYVCVCIYIYIYLASGSDSVQYTPLNRPQSQRKIEKQKCVNHTY